MSDICPGCGVYDPEMSIDTESSTAVCPACGHTVRFLQLPLFLITGASGAGKSSVCGLLPSLLPECVVLDADLLWREEFRAEDDSKRSGFHDVWLRVAKSINQGGRPVVLCGTVFPSKLEGLPQRRYFSDLFYLALVSDDRTLEDRLRRRPDWRFHHTDRAEFTNKMVEFNRWLTDNAGTTEPPMDLLDTSTLTTDEVATRTTEWVRQHLHPEPLDHSP
jgi:hypothetical protein